MRLFKLVELNNSSSVGKIEVGNTHEIKFDGVQFYFGAIYSSRVSNIKCSKGLLKITTKNSVYSFIELEK